MRIQSNKGERKKQPSFSAFIENPASSDPDFCKAISNYLAFFGKLFPKYKDKIHTDTKTSMPKGHN